MELSFDIEEHLRQRRSWQLIDEPLIFGRFMSVDKLGYVLDTRMLLILWHDLSTFGEPSLSDPELTFVRPRAFFQSDLFHCHELIGLMVSPKPDDGESASKELG